MPEEANKPVYLVNAISDPVLVRIEGRASFQNSAALKDFFMTMVSQGHTRFAIDFCHCVSMDSTALGVLAGAALQLRKLNPPGSLTLCRLGARNLELVRNLGLYRLLTVDAGGDQLRFNGVAQPLAAPKIRDDLAAARLALEAHENLIAADPSNQARFQDVLTFMRNRVESK